MAKLTLGGLLVSAGTITKDQLKEARTIIENEGKRLPVVLVENNMVTEMELIETLQDQLGVEYVDLTNINIPIEMAQVIPKSMATNYQVVVYKIENDTLYLAMSDPLNYYAVEDVRKVTRKKVVSAVSTTGAIEHAIMILYGNEGAERAIQDIERSASEKNKEDDDLSGTFVSNTIEDNLSAPPTIRLVNSIIERSIHERASDIHLEPREKSMIVRMRIDGIMRNILSIPKSVQNSVISRIKIMSGLDISERRVPQDGRFNVKTADKDIDMRVSTLPTVYGEKIVARLLDKSGGVLGKEAIGLEGHDLELFDELMNIHYGVILIVGPTGSGKSSTMYTMIGELNTEEVNLVTLEDPVEYNIDGINQVQINEKTGMTFASGLRAILRQDPDIIAVGEIRDGETADIAMRSAITGHVVLSTIHTNDSIGTVDRLVDIGVEPYLISSALKGVISQRLLRRVCPHCRKAYTPSSEELRSLGLPTEGDYTFYKGEGCPDCFNTGYRGRIAVFEILKVDSAVRSVIGMNKGREALYEELSKPGSGFVSLHENAIRLLKKGVTSSSEVLRVINEEE